MTIGDARVACFGTSLSQSGLFGSSSRSLAEAIRAPDVQVTNVTTTNQRLGKLIQIAKSGGLRWIAAEPELYRAYQQAIISGRSTTTGRKGFNLLRKRMQTRVTLEGSVHHWRYPVKQYSTEAMAAENLYVTSSYEIHMQLHQAIGIQGPHTQGMAWGQEREIQYMFQFMASKQRLADVGKALPPLE